MADKNESSNGYVIENSSIKELVAFVDEAQGYALKNGKERAFREFDNKTGEFVRGDLYIYAYDFNGINLAHPFRPEFIGKDKSNLSDSNGVAYIKDLIDNARRDRGFTYFIFPNPAHGNKNELKLGYVRKVDGSWWLGSGVYLSDVAADFSLKSRKDLVSFVNGAFNFTMEQGKEESLKAFNNRTGQFVKGSLYIFAYDFKGDVLALPFQTQLIGQNRLDTMDPNEVKFVQNAIDQAERGQGFIYYIYPNPDRNMTSQLKLSYIKRIDETWFIGAGIYAGNTTA